MARVRVPLNSNPSQQAGVVSWLHNIAYSFVYYGFKVNSVSFQSLIQDNLEIWDKPKIQNNSAF